MALPHARIMIHNPSATVQGPAHEIKVELEEVSRLEKNIIRQYSQMTGQTQDKLAIDLSRDYFM